MVLTLGNGSTRPGQLTLRHFHVGTWATGHGARLPELSASRAWPAAAPRSGVHCGQRGGGAVLTITNLFCGVGGSRLGATAAGYQLVMAAKHWQRAIDPAVAGRTQPVLAKCHTCPATFEEIIRAGLEHG